MPTYPTPGIAPPIFYNLAACPIRNGAAVILKKWPALVVCHLSFGTHRFSELAGGLPDISQRMLTKTLRELERDGFVSRTVTASVPPRVDYDLTDLGRSLLPSLQSVLQWGARNMAAVKSNREAAGDTR